MIQKQIVIGRAISAIDALQMKAPEFAIKDMRYAIKLRPKLSILKKMETDVNNMQISLAEQDLDELEKQLY